MFFGFLAAIALSSAIALSVLIIAKTFKDFDIMAVSFILTALYIIGIMSTFASFDTQMSRSIAKAISYEIEASKYR